MLKQDSKTELKKVAKAIEYGVDLKKLEREIANLESKKVSAINELSEMKKSVNESILEDRKLIAKEREVFNSEMASTENSMEERSKKVAKSEEQVSKKQDALSNLKTQIEGQDKHISEFTIEKEDVEKVRVSSMEREHKANLTIKQFEGKIEELDGKLTEVNEKLEELNSKAK